jgi:hypothetical protein
VIGAKRGDFAPEGALEFSPGLLALRTLIFQTYDLGRHFSSFVPVSQNYGGHAGRIFLRDYPGPKAFGPGLFS